MSDHMRGDFAANINGDIPERRGLLYTRSICGVAGPSGVGKSFAVRKMAAEWSRTRGNVIYGNLEDDRIMQRFSLEAAGADMSKVRLASYNIARDLDELRYDLQVQKASLVVFDTAAKHLAPIPFARWDEPLANLHMLCQELDVTALLVHHTNKGVKANDDWRAAIGGATSGYLGSCRIILLAGARPDNPDQFLLAPAKDSYAQPLPAVAYEWGTEDMTMQSGEEREISFLTKVEDGIKVQSLTAIVCLKGEKDGAKGPSPEKAAEAATFMQDTLAHGPHPLNDVYRCKTNPDSTRKPDDLDWKSRDCGHMAVHTVEAAGGKCPGCDGPVTQIEGIKSLAEAAMVSYGTLKRAKSALGIDTDCKGFSKDRVQFWSLPDGHPNLIAGPRNVLIDVDSGDKDAGGNTVFVQALSSLPLA